MNVSTNCPHCSQEIKSGLLKSNQLLSPIKLELLNLFESPARRGACSACGDKAYARAYQTAQKELSDLNGKMMELLPCIPLLSISSPANWEYTPVALVTAQSTTGTGIWSDLTTSFTDPFGMQSKAYNQKIAAGEKLCRQTIRLKTLHFRCNAVIGVDIDYAEVGGGKGMLMVCMTGTAVRLSNLTGLATEQQQNAATLNTTYEEFQRLNSVFTKAPDPFAI